jgi:3-dehydrosphinganine reductase
VARVEAGTAVVSGGSSGIGLACARELARRGFRIALIARDPERLALAAQILAADGAPHVATFALDVTDARACAQAIERIEGELGAMDWLIASAGDATPGMFDALEASAHRAQMEVNYFGALNLVMPASTRMAARGAGRIVLVSSAAAFVGVTGYSAYAPGKFALRGLGEILRVELGARGVCVSVAFPPDTRTPLLERELTTRPPISSRMAAAGGLFSAEAVAANIIADAMKGRFVLAPSLLLRLYAWSHSLYAPFLLARQRRTLARMIAGDAGRRDGA